MTQEPISGTAAGAATALMDPLSASHLTTIVSHDIDIRSHDPDGTPRRMGFFTDSSLCIGCKACEVACKEWNQVPGGEELSFTGESYDNTTALGCNAWRHVAFIEQTREVGVPGDGAGPATRWLMASDVCKHCANAACLDVCPTGAITRTEFGTVVVQPDVCNGCGYCVSACPFGVLERRPDDGRVWKCTLCYDRLKEDMEPACAKACPTKSIQFGQLSELLPMADARVAELHRRGVGEARLYGADRSDGVGGFGAFFLLLDDPEVYGLPPDPVDTTRDAWQAWSAAGVAALGLLATIGAAFLARGRE
jgi:formate dehydrogenase iron-sulfur subunit